jgi:hypothetical protein
MMDVKQVVEGKLVQPPLIEEPFAINPVTVDTDAGTVRVFGIVTTQFKTLQKGSTESDYVAMMGTDMISLRIWRQPVQVLYILNNQLIYSGTCSEIN